MRKKHFTVKQVKAIKKILLADNNVRDYCLMSLQIDTMLRSGDVLKLRVGDVVDSNGAIKDTLEIKQTKTGSSTTCILQDDTRSALIRMIDEKQLNRDEYLFTNGVHKDKGNKPLTLMSHTRRVKRWCEMIGLDPEYYSTHSLRRSKSVAIYEATHNIEAIRLLLGHRSLGATMAYLGVDKKESLDISRKFTF